MPSPIQPGFLSDSDDSLGVLTLSFFFASFFSADAADAVESGVAVVVAVPELSTPCFSSSLDCFSASRRSTRSLHCSSISRRLSCRAFSVSERGR